MRYGLPYKGSKNQIAKWIIEQLPEAPVFIDLFAGGCAVTHAALLSGKYERVIANDINGMPIIFKNAINGDFDGYATVPDRNGFMLSDDAVLKMLFSYGCDHHSYLWGGRYEALKVPASRMISAPSMYERRAHYREFIRALQKYIDDVIRDSDARLQRLQELESQERLQSLEWLQGLQNMERLQQMEGLQNSERLQVMVGDYRNINLPAGAVVYADPPYRGGIANNYGCSEAEGFDFNALDDWLAEVDTPVYVSEFTAPRGCVCIAERERACNYTGAANRTVIERLFIQERYADGALHA